MRALVIAAHAEAVLNETLDMMKENGK